MNKNVDAIIIGAGLTGLTTAFYLQKAGKSVLIFEKAKRTGGVIQTTYTDDFVYETGPNSGSMGSPEMAELFEDLGDAVELEVASEASKDRWIWKNGKWHSLPSSLWLGLTTPLFSMYDKFRILGEPFRKKGDNPHETVSELVKRRLGKSFLNYAVNPFISGIYAGDPSQLVTKYALSKLYKLEQTYGSFIGGSIKKAKTRTERDKKATREVFTAKGGKQKLIDALCSAIGEENIILDAENLKVEKQEVYTVASKAATASAPVVISTAGAYALPELFPFITKEDMSAISNLKYAKVVQVVCGYKKWDGLPLKAFGGLIPEVEKRDCLGILFPSSIFSGRAPEGGALFTLFMGGVKRPDIVEMSDDEIKTLALKEIRETLKCDIKPDLMDIKRYQRAIPQYDATSKERLEAIAKIEKANTGLFLAGNIRDGIGMSDRVTQARKIASPNPSEGGELD